MNLFIYIVTFLLVLLHQRRRHYCDMGWGAKAPTPKYISDFAFAFKIKSTGYHRQREIAFAFGILR